MHRWARFRRPFISSAATPRAGWRSRAATSRSKARSRPRSRARSSARCPTTPMRRCSTTTSRSMHDGMIARFNIEGGAVDFDIRYVETERYLAEKKARRALFGRYRNPFTDDPERRGRGPHGRQHHPGVARRAAVHDQGGRARLRDQSAHARDRGQVGLRRASSSRRPSPPTRGSIPTTGEMFFFGYEAGGLCDPDVAYCIADKDGNLVKEQWFEQPYLLDHPRLRDHREIRDLPDLPDRWPTSTGSRPAGRTGRTSRTSRAGSAIMPRYGDVERDEVDRGAGRRLVLPRGQRPTTTATWSTSTCA